MHRIALVVFDGVVATDLTIPADTFAEVQLADGRSGYRLKICGVRRFVETSVGRLEIREGLSALRSADTVIIPGIDRPDRPVDPRILRAIRRAAQRGARIASVCSGALVLARTGLLDGKRATTHWAAAEVLAELHPAIEVDPSVLYVDGGNILTSAGGMASLDLCLHMIRLDYGAAVAAAAARRAVMPLERSGGQAQFILQKPPSSGEGDSLAELLEWMQKNLDSDLSVEALARRAGMSGRSFARHFKEQIGTTPARWVTTARVRQAQVLLETTDLPVERIGDAVGFGSGAAFRARFQELTGVSPLAHRRTFRGAA
jgi:transcriptional regulator GlxA family with amidase domain